jgi:sulfide:quinone oxidoreductase
MQVLIAGGGVAALEALIALRRLAEERVEIDLLSTSPEFWYRPLSVGEPFGLSQVHPLDLGLVAEEFGAGLTLGTLVAVDPDDRIARTSAGAELEFDALLVAVGARPVVGVEGAITFRGPADTPSITKLLQEIEAGVVGRVAFAVPGGAGWPLPLYELAMGTAAHARRHGTEAQVVLVTPEESPLALFGPAASEAIAGRLAELEIEVCRGVYPVAFEDGVLSLAPEGSIGADRIVALPRLEGPGIEGLPCDQDRFIPIDPSGRVHGLYDVFAAGDAVKFPVKQGGLATQQADAAAESIAAMAGADVTPKPFRPVLRGLILTGAVPLFARASISEVGPPYATGTEALWWPPGKIAGHYLAPYLAERSGDILSPPEAAAVAVEVELGVRS